MSTLWPSGGFSELTHTARGWLAPSDGWLRPFLALPELALVAESCAGEIALHRALHHTPLAETAPGALAAVQDADARANYAAFLGFRDGLREAGSLEGFYLATIRSERIALPPVFLQRVVEAIVQNVLGPDATALEARASELLFRTQRISTREGRLLCADSETLDMGRSNINPAGERQLRVLHADNAVDYFAESDAHGFALDLTHETRSDIGHGVHFTLRRSGSGLAALARVLEGWMQHLLGVQTTIVPMSRVEDANWRWHIGLDAESMRLLNDLYEAREVEPERLQRLVSLFRLDFVDHAEMRSDVAGRPVYLGLAMTEAQTLALKPQNLLLNLPLASGM
ncbi:MAG: DUF6352 family protein [Variovorax sp.]